MNELLKRKATFAPLLDIGASTLYQRRKRQQSLSPRYLTSNYVYLLPVLGSVNVEVYLLKTDRGDRSYRSQ